MTEVALRTFVAAPCQCTRLMFGLAISQTLHIPPFFMDFLSSFYYNKVREYKPCGLYGRHLRLVGSPRHGWVFHVHVVLVQHPVYVALSPIAGTLKDHAPYNDKLHIAVYIRSKEPIQPKDDRLHILGFDDDDWKVFTDELWEKGYTYQRWGKLLPDVTDLPEVGDLVVFIHQEEDKSIIYLMKLIAEGNELVEPLLTHDEELEYIDDCNPYVLTVIKGPMTFIADDLDFLSTPWEGHCRPDFKLEKDASDNLLTLLQGKSQ